METEQEYMERLTAGSFGRPMTEDYLAELRGIASRAAKKDEAAKVKAARSRARYHERRRIPDDNAGIPVGTE